MGSTVPRSRKETRMYSVGIDAHDGVYAFGHGQPVANAAWKQPKSAIESEPLPLQSA